MQQKLSVVSAVLLAIAALILVAIPQYFEANIDTLRAENEEIASSQKIAATFLLLANFEYQLASLQRDDLDILKQLVKDSPSLQSKEEAIALSRQQAAVHAINACAAANAITPTDAEHEVTRISAITDKEQVHSIYLKYATMAANGTEILDSQQSAHFKTVVQLRRAKNGLWHIAVFLQLIGLALAVLVVAKNASPNPKRGKALTTRCSVPGQEKC